MYNYLYDDNKCVLKHCQKEQERAKQQHETYVKQLSKLLTLLVKKKISTTEFNRKTKQIQNKIIKNKDKIKFLDCQIKHCNKIVKSKMIQTIKDMIKMKVNNEDYNPRDYTKYLDYVKKNKITTKTIIESEIESQRRIEKMMEKYNKK
jgi:hypothetical protein